MEQSKILNWQNILILSILLSFSPFYISTGSFLFHYSILGYGLALISFYYKKSLKKIDVIIISSLVLILCCGILKKYEWYSFFGFIFYVLIIVMVYLSSKNPIVRIISHFLIFIAGIILPMRYLFINFPVIIRKIVFFDYVFGGFFIVLVLFEKYYKK